MAALPPQHGWPLSLPRYCLHRWHPSAGGTSPALPGPQPWRARGQGPWKRHCARRAPAEQPTPARVDLAQRPARLCAQVQLGPDFSPAPSRTFHGVSAPTSCPGSSACLNVLAEGAHYKRGRDRLQAGTSPGKRSPPLSKPDGPQHHNTSWAVPETLVTASLIPRGPQPGHAQPAWRARD